MAIRPGRHGDTRVRCLPAVNSYWGLNIQCLIAHYCNTLTGYISTWLVQGHLSSLGDGGEILVKVAIALLAVIHQRRFFSQATEKAVREYCDALTLCLSHFVSQFRSLPVSQFHSVPGPF